MQILMRCIALLYALSLLTGLGAAQTNNSAAQVPQHAPDQIHNQQPTAATQGEQPHTAPVFWISDVEVMRSAHAPQLDVVRVRGLVTTEGWEAAELVPLSKNVPADGILDLALVAEAPLDSTAPAAYPQIEAVFVIEPGHPFKGVRVHGASNRVVVTTLPGYSASKAPPRDCANCAGKLLVRKGQAMPPERSAETIVREEDLPATLRVIRESEGIGSLESNPNRLTLLLNEKGEIAAMFWD